LVSFNGPNGSIPFTSLTADSSGNLYGTTLAGGSTSSGGTSGAGTVFKIAAGTKTFSILASFTQATGVSPVGSLLVDHSGNLFGATQGGNGTLFEITADTHSLMTVATFNGVNGARPVGGLMADASGNIYGVTSAGGANNKGTVFQLAAGTH